MAKKTSPWELLSLKINGFSLIHYLPHFSFIVFLAAIYIANVHYAEKKMRKIEARKVVEKELRWKFMSLQSELMYRSKQSELEKEIQRRDMQLNPLGNTPKKIVAPQR